MQQNNSTTNVNEVKGYVPFRGSVRPRLSMVQIVSNVLGYFVGLDVDGYNLLYAVLYVYKVLRSIRGGPRATRADSEVDGIHDPSETRRWKRSHDQHGPVDANDILDIVQDGFLRFHESRRGRNGQLPENLDTRAALRRACDTWYRRERKEENKRRNLKNRLLAMVSRVEKSLDPLLADGLLAYVGSKDRVVQMIQLIGEGHKKSAVAKQLGVSNAWVSKALKALRLARTRSRLRAEETAASIPVATPQSGQQDDNGTWFVPSATYTVGSLVSDPRTFQHDDTVYTLTDIPGGHDTLSDMVCDPWHYSHANVGLPALPMLACECRQSARFNPPRPWYYITDAKGNDIDIPPGI